MSECIPTHRVAFVRLMGNFFLVRLQIAFQTYGVKHNIWLIETLFQGWLVISVVAHVLKDIFLLLQWFHFYLNYVSLRRIKHTMYMFFPI